MRKLLIVLGLIAAFFGTKAILNSLKQPAEGTVKVIAEPADPTPTETATVVVVVEEEPMNPVDPEVIPEPMPEPEMFKPLSFKKGSLNKFAREHNAVIITIKGVKYAKVGNAYYFKKGKKTFVRHEGEIIPLN